MYDDVYCGMVKSGITFELENWAWVNKQGLIVELWKKNKIPTYPAKLPYICGWNWGWHKSKHDGNHGGEKFIVGVKERALLSSSFDGCHWTSLGFTLGDGRPLLCLIIIACSEIDAKTRIGAQPWCELQGNLVDNLEENSHGPHNTSYMGPHVL